VENRLDNPRSVNPQSNVSSGNCAGIHTARPGWERVPSVCLPQLSMVFLSKSSNLDLVLKALHWVYLGRSWQRGGLEAAETGPGLPRGTADGCDHPSHQRLCCHASSYCRYAPDVSIILCLAEKTFRSGKEGGKERWAIFSHLDSYSKSSLSFPSEEQGSSGNPTPQRQVLSKNHAATSILG